MALAERAINSHMPVSCTELWPSDNLSDQIQHWAFIAGKLGANPSLPRPLLIGIRGVAPNDGVTHPTVHFPRYDDTFVLLTPTAPPLVFAGATHAYQRDSKLSPDVDRDGRRDVGSIRPGNYLLTDTRSMPYPIFHLTLDDGKTDRIPAYRDTNHDGDLSPEEEKASVDRRTGAQVDSQGDYATAVLLHTGFDAPADAQQRSSIACQTCSLQWLVHLRKAAKASKGLIDYRLQRAEALLEIAKDRPRAAPANVS
jgi:hypothetical protein